MKLTDAPRREKYEDERIQQPGFSDNDPTVSGAYLLAGFCVRERAKDTTVD